jgi:hypothetical protein
VHPYIHGTRLTTAINIAGVIFHLFAILLAVASLGCFVKGMLVVAAAVAIR